MRKNNEIPVCFEGRPIYDIVLEEGLTSLSDRFLKSVPECGKVLLVSDSRVAGLYLEDTVKALSSAGVGTETYVFPEGEKNKTLDTVREIYGKLAGCRFQRGDCLAALGGGVTGDITGFAAATYLRGVRFIQLPTTVLACCDSSIGGKTGVDFDGWKNYVGAFHMPSLVFMNMGFLRSLDDRQYRAGMAEAVKSALIRDRSMFEDMLEDTASINARKPEVVSDIIYRSCLIKKSVVEIDPEEKGVRAVLNFGHTLGHAIEKLSGFSMLHGECVSVGSVLASYISMKRGMISEKEYSDIVTLLDSLGLPVRTPPDISLDEVIAAAHSDKKALGSSIKFILLEGIGNGIIDRSVTDGEMYDALVALKGQAS